MSVYSKNIIHIVTLYYTFNLPSSPASCAPPTKNTFFPSASKGAYNSLKGSCPAHITIVSTSNTICLPFLSITNPLSLISMYLQPSNSSTPLIFIVVRCIQPVVLPSVLPNLPSLRCSKYNLRPLDLTG